MRLGFSAAWMPPRLELINAVGVAVVDDAEATGGGFGERVALHEVIVEVELEQVVAQQQAETFFRAG